MPHFKKQMLRAPELGCSRMACVIKGVSNMGGDLSPYASEMHQSLVKVLIGTNEENIATSKAALQTLYGSCNSAQVDLVSLPEYLRKVWNGKEGKIVAATTKMELLSLFGAFAKCGLEVRVAAVGALCACGEKESAQPVLGKAT